MASQSMTRRGRETAGRWLLALLIVVPLAACSGKDWPRLVDVQRPKESQTYTIPAPETAEETAGTEKPAPPPSSSDALPLDPEALDAASARLDLALKHLDTAEADYAAALEYFLTSSSGEDMAERWSAAQHQLTRMGAAVGELAGVNRELAALGLGTVPDTPQDIVLALGREMMRVDAVYQGWPDALLVENSRLATLTPPQMGAPGPRAFEPGERSPYIRIDLGNPAAAFAGDLGPPVTRALQVAPDLRFDLIAIGPDRSAAQTNLRRVTAALLRVGVPRSQLVVALQERPDAEGSGEALIYLRKRSR